MNPILRHTLLAAICTAAATLSAANKIVEEIAPYVYPSNRPAAPASMTFMPDGESYLMADDAKTRVVQFDTKSGNETAVIFDCANTREAKITSFEGYTLSPDATKLLLWRGSESIYRHSFKAAYFVYEIRSRILRPLSTTQLKQQAPVFSPDGRSVAFVSDNNIYIKKLDYNTEVPVTTDGTLNSVINGVPDWVYEEEFATDCSMVWAPDSETLCYLKYNEIDVPVYSLTMYEGTCNPRREYALYPGSFSYKYPVAGEPNSRVSLHSYDVANRKTKEITFEDSNIEYIPRIMYADPTQLIVATLNRDQNRMEIYSVNPKSTMVKSLIVEQHKAWLLPASYEQISLTGKSIVIHSSRSGFNHLYEYSLAGALIRQITSGDYDVTDFYGIDAAGSAYYRSTKSGPLNRVISKLDTKGKVTDLTPADKTAAATFTTNLNYFRLSISDALTPPVHTLCTAAGKTLRVLEDNASYAARFANAPRKEFFTINSDGNSLNAYMIKPLDFNASKRYPVIMWQYSGPGSQEVLNAWKMDWDSYAATRGYIVVCVDGRGTGARGRAFMDVVYKNLGYYETIDQINAAHEIARLPYVDPDRIGIAGWSYGGYETLMCASALDAPFRAAVAIAPVTDWRYYDTVYAERYMLTPRQNEDGYRDSAPINRARQLKCDLLLMYGTADDNVHPANSIEYVSHLQSEGILCDMLIFPNMNHSIFGCNARSVVYGKMLDYFDKNLK